MKSLISVNYKFMDISPKDLVDLIKSSKYTKGIELNIDYENKNELKYLDDLVFELKKNNLVLQIHGETSLQIDKQIEYMKKLESYSDYFGFPIVVTFHTIYDEDNNMSLKKTIDYISNIISSINNEKIIISLENLNDIKGFIRLGKDEIRSAVLNDEKLYFTYDIGHEIANYNLDINLDEYMINDIRNVHIHSYDDKGLDHMPIYKNDNHINEIIKSLLFLIANNYKYNIVYEYGLEYCKGNTVEEKIKDYLYSIDFVSEKYN